MAEMMVVVVILGVITALVLPGMMQDHQKQINLAKTLKLYNDISKMVALKNLNEENEFELDITYDSSGKVIKRRVTSDAALAYYAPLKPVLCNRDKKTWKYKWLNGTDCDENVCFTNQGATCLSLPDGSSISVSNYANEAYRAFAIDPNGKKGPNIVGQDLFIFAITEENGVQPVGSPGAGTGKELFGEDNEDDEDYNRTKLTGTDMYACNDKAEKGGFWCSALLRMDGWTFKEDYPY